MGTSPIHSSCKMSTGFWLQYNQLTDTILNVMTCFCENFSENKHTYTYYSSELCLRIFFPGSFDWLCVVQRINILGLII